MPPPGAPEAIPSGYAFAFSVTGVALECPFSTGVGAWTQPVAGQGGLGGKEGAGGASDRTWGSQAGLRKLGLGRG